MIQQTHMRISKRARAALAATLETKSKTLQSALRRTLVKRFNDPDDLRRVGYTGVDLLDPGETGSAGEFLRRVRSAVARSSAWIVCGGTGGTYAAPKPASSM